jgi:hypothetical protein
MHWLDKFAESYGGGSSGVDYLSTEDGSETRQDEINTDSPSNGEGQGRVPDYGKLEHPITPDGESFHNSDNTYQGKDEHEGRDSNLFVTQPFGEQMVDDNHANADGGGSNTSLFGNAMLNLMKSAGDETDFFTSKTQGGPADSPQILDDGYADEELERDTEGVENTINDFDPNTKDDSSWIQHPDIVDRNIRDKKMNDNDAEIYQGSTSFAHLKSRPSLITHIPVKKAATVPEGQHSKEALPEDAGNINEWLVPAPVKGRHLPAHPRLNEQPMDKPSMFSTNNYHWGDDSNVDQVEYPDEERNIEKNKKEDFGNKDYGALTDMADAPNQTDSNEESNNYSGINSTNNLLSIIMTKKADNTAVMPSSNPNSGRDDEDDEVRQTMNDGKPSNVNVADKEYNGTGDIYWNRHLKYENKTQGPENYFSTINSGSGFGMEGDGQNQSGVNNV